MVDSKELRIGDWVGFLPTWKNEDCTIQREGNPNNPIICKVEMLGGSGAQLDNGEDYFDADDIELYPIPITPEILLKNGWVLTSGYYVLKDKEARLGWQPYGEFVLGYSLFPKKVLYVHELQNIMIDCGIKGGIEL